MLMNKVLVNIYFPSVCRSYDVYIPCDTEISEIAEMLAPLCGELTDYMFIPSEDSVLCDRVTGNALDVNLTPHELCLVNGSKLMYV